MYKATSISSSLNLEFMVIEEIVEIVKEESNVKIGQEKLMSEISNKDMKESNNYCQGEGIEKKTGVFEIRLNCKKEKNKFKEEFWSELPLCVHFLDNLPACRCIILTSTGNVFSAGIDLAYALKNLNCNSDDSARKAIHIRRFIEFLQSSINVLEQCLKPIIALVHGACIGAGCNLICACDIRLCSKDSYFCVKEIDLGLAADLGIMQRMPRLIGNESLVKEIIYTGRNVSAVEALKIGFISSVAPEADSLRVMGINLALKIASKSPIAITSSKFAINYSRSRSVEDSMQMQAIWNSAMLQTKDLALSVEMVKKKKQKKNEKVHFSNL